MAKGPLGFGWMRLPQLSQESTDIDYEQVNQMVDLYLDSGFDYFDTSYVYHDGVSETAINKCLVSRHPRERASVWRQNFRFSRSRKKNRWNRFSLNSLKNAVWITLIIICSTM